MLEHLVQFEPQVLSTDDEADFLPLKDAMPDQVLAAQTQTADWLDELGAKPDSDISKDAQTSAARKAFVALTTTVSAEETKTKLLELQTPPAVRHLVGMLTAYDWEFVNQAKSLRGYAVAKILEEVENPSANIRLKALGLLGKITEVGLFTEKIEVKKTDLTEDEIERKLKEKLAKFIGVEDAEVTDVTPLEENERPAE